MEGWGDVEVDQGRKKQGKGKKASVKVFASGPIKSNRGSAGGEKEWESPQCL